jgi:antirestriction protein ArdC
MMPGNYKSKKNYRGINLLYLSMLPFESPYYMTYNQISELGGNVKKGEKGIPVVFWKFFTMTKSIDDPGCLQSKLPSVRNTAHTDTGAEVFEKKGAMVRYYTVFNTDQCEGLDIVIPKAEDEKTLEFNPIKECESIIESFINKPVIEHKGIRACYSPLHDVVTMPENERFHSCEKYYSTLFHELVHSSGHLSRLNREGFMSGASFGSKKYSKEELIAEMGAAFLCAHAGIENETIDNSAAYLKGWIKVLREDNKILLSAAQQAQKAYDHILGVTYEEENAQ